MFLLDSLQQNTNLVGVLHALSEPLATRIARRASAQVADGVNQNLQRSPVKFSCETAATAAKAAAYRWDTVGLRR